MENMNIHIFEKPVLVSCRELGIPSENYYFTRRDNFDLSLDELNNVGVTSEDNFIHPDLARPLQSAYQEFKKLGLEMKVSDAYRSPELYQLIYDKRVIIHGKEHTDNGLNMQLIPHSTGRAVDIQIRTNNGDIFWMRDEKKDGQPSWFVGYYAASNHERADEFLQNQQVLMNIMFAQGFVLGSKKEYWHFELPAA
jgi:D-alanyl-D-alanine dipeptidase